jgi:hypothetical protein
MVEMKGHSCVTLTLFEEYIIMEEWEKKVSLHFRIEDQKPKQIPRRYQRKENVNYREDEMR